MGTEKAGQVLFLRSWVYDILNLCLALIVQTLEITVIILSIEPTLVSQSSLKGKAGQVPLFFEGTCSYHQVNDFGAKN